jgi:hypothetical protein
MKYFLLIFCFVATGLRSMDSEQSPPTCIEECSAYRYCSPLSFYEKSVELGRSLSRHHLWEFRRIYAGYSLEKLREALQECQGFILQLIGCTQCIDYDHVALRIWALMELDFLAVERDSMHCASCIKNEYFEQDLTQVGKWRERDVLIKIEKELFSRNMHLVWYPPSTLMEACCYLAQDSDHLPPYLGGAMAKICPPDELQTQVHQLLDQEEEGSLANERWVTALKKQYADLVIKAAEPVNPQDRKRSAELIDTYLKLKTLKLPCCGGK